MYPPLMDCRHVHCHVAQQATTGNTENWLIVGQEVEGNQLIAQGPDKEHHEEELFDEQEEELEDLPEPEEPHEEPEGLPGVQQADQQQQHEHGGRHWRHADELAAAQGLVAHHRRSGNRTVELPDLRGRLSGSALEREWQINEEVAHEVEAQIIGMRQQCEAQRLVSNGDGRTLLLRNRCAEEGLNAADGNRFNAFLHPQLDQS